jgi:hypothetical protein
MLKMANLAIDWQYHPSRVFGVDFSGAIDAGTKIWVASGTIVSNVLKVEYCCQAKELLRTTERDQCLRALWQFISTQKDCAFGLDFPFGLPRDLIPDLVKENSWEEFARSFGRRYPSPQEFTRITHAIADGKEKWRKTDQKDKEARPPLPVNNRRLYKQTYCGIRDVLAPLVREQLVCVLPMQGISPHIPWLFEICPASTVKKRLHIMSSYKGRTKEKDEEKYFVRKRILQKIEETGVLELPESNLKSRILNDRHGDALDSVIAAFATFRALGDPACFTVPRTSPYALEGYIYV